MKPMENIPILDFHLVDNLSTFSWMLNYHTLETLLGIQNSTPTPSPS
jgi:hypothetical protein